MTAIRRPAQGRPARQPSAAVRSPVNHEMRLRAAALVALEIEYIASPEFGDAQRVVEIEADRGLPADFALRESDAGLRKARKNLPPYLASLFTTRLLPADEERRLFRRMNYAKFKADQLRQELNPRRARRAVVEEIEALVDEAEQIRGLLIRANLRLVVSIAKRFVDSSNTFYELVSDGNISLIRAVEKFDYYLGNRFSTYATYAVRRNFFRTVIKRREDRQRCPLADEELLATAAPVDDPETLGEKQVLDLRHRLAGLLHRLNDRERSVVQARFGFGGDGRLKTFQQLGDEFGVCKERVRQIQVRAMEKLRLLAEEAHLDTFGDD
ncbi:MAG: sigma-70 family RNA polymerase sigma factor [Pirellulales bacterium]